MVKWFAENMGTIVIGLLLILVLACVIMYLIREKRAGKSACGNACASCPMHGSCHKQ